ncbi:hypothetical protein HIM_00612 [Hirsutella minnesotensis 3608]|nr:hypothetical protein HIM_00612 [Hirsutella minnesotensis 3608]
MSKVLVVFGATGQQGSSVVQQVLNDTELSQTYRIRAITRNANSPNAMQLKDKAEVLEGDMLDRGFVERALAGAHTVFLMTAPVFGPDGLDAEFNAAKVIADVAVEKGVEYLIFSTLPAVRDISGGKFTNVTPFDAKAKAEQYIRSLPLRSAFYCPGSFMENFASQTFLGPKPVGDGKWVLRRPVPASARLPLIDAVGDGGKFVGAILAQPDRYAGKTFHASTALYDWDEMAAAISRATGKTVIYEQMPVDEFAREMPFAPEMWSDAFGYYAECGYFGPDTESLVAWAAENARGRLTTLDEYLQAHPLEL